MEKNLLLKFVVLFFSILLWYQLVLVQEHITEIDLPVKLENLPDKLIFYDEGIKTIPIKVKASGMDLIFLKLSDSHFLINGENFKYGKNITNIKEDDLKIPKRINYEIISIGNSKRQILNIDKLETSYKPIKLTYASSKDEEFFIENKILLHNKRVQISGPQSILDTLEYVESNPASRKDVVGNKLNLKLIPPHSKILLEQEKIVLEISKTEMKIRTISLIPIKYPENENITIIPQKISVMVSGPKEIVEKLNQHSVEATLDNSNLLNSNTRKVNIKLPAGVNLLEYTPNKIQIIKND